MPDDHRAKSVSQFVAQCFAAVTIQVSNQVTEDAIRSLEYVKFVSEDVSVIAVFALSRSNEPTQCSSSLGAQVIQFITVVKVKYHSRSFYDARNGSGVPY